MRKIHLIGKEKPYDEPDIPWSLGEYLEFIQVAKRALVLDDILKNVTWGCETCRSFTVRTDALFRALNDSLDYMSEEPDESLDVYDSMHEIMSALIEPVVFTDDEHMRFERGDLMIADLVLKDNDLLRDESTGDLMRYIASEVAIVFDVDCNCNSIIDNM